MTPVKTVVVEMDWQGQFSFVVIVRVVASSSSLKDKEAKSSSFIFNGWGLEPFDFSLN